MPMHFIVRLQPQAGRADEFREALLAVIAPTRAEAGCIAIRVYESAGGPVQFAIHSEWLNEEAFDLHASLPHTIRFLEAAKQLLTHPVQGFRAREIGGGKGAGAGLA